MSAFVDEKGDTVPVKLGDAISTAKLGYGYDTLAKPPTPQLVAMADALTQRALAAPAPMILAAMQTRNFSVGSGGATVTLAPADAAEPKPEATESMAPSQAPRGGAAGPTTLILSGIRLLRRPPAPLSVFLNLPKGASPQLNGPYYVGTLNFFNFDLATGRPMAHGNEHENHGPPAPAEARFDVAQVLADQRLKGLWDGGAISVTITTIGADTPGDLTYVSFESATLTP